MKNVLLVLTVIGLVSAVFMAVAATPVPDDYIQELEWGDSVRVRGGDTLWGIVSRINNGSYDSRVLIDAVKQVNGIESTIIPGQEIVVPVVE